MTISKVNQQFLNASELFVSVMQYKLRDKKVAIGKTQDAGPGKMNEFFSQVLAVMKEADLNVFNAYHTVANRHNLRRSAIMKAVDYNSSMLPADMKGEHADLVSGFAAAATLQRLQNTACWMARREMNDKSLSEGEIGEVDYAAVGAFGDQEDGIAPPEGTEDPALAQWAGDVELLSLVLAKLQGNVYTSTDSAYALAPLVVFSQDDIEVDTETGSAVFVTKATASTFDDALALMKESIDDLKDADEAASAANAAEFDYSNV
jgi:hypothetical protein